MRQKPLTSARPLKCALAAICEAPASTQTNPRDPLALLESSFGSGIVSRQRTLEGPGSV